MYLVEPCCAPKHLSELNERLGKDGTTMWHGYGDLSLAELLPPLTMSYAGSDVTIVTPALPDMATEAIAMCMRRKVALMNGGGNMDVIKRLTLLTDFNPAHSPMASRWVKDNPFGERLILRSVQQGDTAIVLPGIALYGPINLTYGRHFTATATKNARTIDALRAIYENLR